MTKPTGYVLHFTECKPGSTVASVRIARWLANRYGLHLCSTPQELAAAPHYAAPDVVILVSSASGFADPEWRNTVGILCASAETYIFAQNDFMTTQAGQVGAGFDRLGKPRKRVVWSTIPAQCNPRHPPARSTFALHPASAYVNWNQLTYQPLPVIQDCAHPRANNLIYYGACRDGRTTYFKRYFGGSPAFGFDISTSKQAVKKWNKLGVEIDRIIPPMEDVIQGCRGYGAALYLEDVQSHKTYHSPANRFYEMLSAGVLQLFDVTTAHTLTRADINVANFTVMGALDVRHWLTAYTPAQRQAFAAQQADAWRRDYIGLLCEQLYEPEKMLGLVP